MPQVEDGKGGQGGEGQYLGVMAERVVLHREGDQVYEQTSYRVCGLETASC